MVIFIFCVFDQKCLFLGKVFQKTSKFFYWSWNLESRLIHTCKIRWWFSFFCFFLIGNTFSGLIWSKSEIWLLGYFKFVKLSIDVHFFYLRPFLVSVVQKSHLIFWCYPINLPAVSSQRIEASDSSFYIYFNIFIIWTFESWHHLTSKCITNFVKTVLSLAVSQL